MLSSSVSPYKRLRLTLTLNSSSAPSLPGYAIPPVPSTNQCCWRGCIKLDVQSMPLFTA